MDQKELQQKIALYYSKLPKEAQEVFSKMEWLETLKQLSIKYGLKEGQTQILGTETTLVLLGIIHLEEYEEKIKNELGLSLEATTKLLSEIDGGVLKNIRPQLSVAFEKNSKETQAPVAPIEEGLDTRFDKLPKDIRKIIVESNYHAKLYAIAQENSLNVIQTGKMEEVATGVITGTIPLDKFEEKLKDRLGLSSELAKNMAREINDTILRPIREEMEVVYGKPKIILPEIKPDLGKIEKAETATSNPINIKIIKPELNILELGSGESQVENINRVKTEGILNQKLNSSVQTPSMKTDYSLKNLPSSGSQKIKPDPYRMSSDE